MTESHGQRRRRQILDSAVDVGSAEGLNGLSVGRLAEETRMSRSGLFAHFGSKQALQLATVRHAARGFEEAVLAPAEGAEPGLPRLEALLGAWLDFIESTANRGGCFFDAASSEFASRPGQVRELLAELSGRWLKRLEEEARLALRLGELNPGTDPALLAFQLHAYVAEANWCRELLADARAFTTARAAIRTTLDHCLRAEKEEDEV